MQAVGLIFSLLAPKLQFKGSNKRGIPVSRDIAALLAKYSDPLVYTGPIRVRTGHEILCISSFLLHKTADRVTDPLASQDLYKEAASRHKVIRWTCSSSAMRLKQNTPTTKTDEFLQDLLFEPERDEIGADIIHWMDGMLKM
jgi:acylglycerol lipase